MVSFYIIFPAGNTQMIRQQKENMGQHQLPLSPTEASQRTVQSGLLFIPQLSKEETFIKNGEAVIC